MRVSKCQPIQVGDTVRLRAQYLPLGTTYSQAPTTTVKQRLRGGGVRVVLEDQLNGFDCWKRTDLAVVKRAVQKKKHDKPPKRS